MAIGIQELFFDQCFLKTLDRLFMVSKWYFIYDISRKNEMSLLFGNRWCFFSFSALCRFIVLLYVLLHLQWITCVRGPWNVCSKPLYEIAGVKARHKAFYAWFFCWLDPWFYTKPWFWMILLKVWLLEGWVRAPYFIEDTFAFSVLLFFLSQEVTWNMNLMHVFWIE